MISLLKKIKRLLVLNREIYLDGKRFMAAVPSGGPADPHRRSHLESDIVRRYHVLEKGLSMPEFRPGFGIPMVRDLMNNLAEWESSGFPIHGQIESAKAVLRSYRERHELLKFDLEGLFDGVDLGGPSQDGSGGVRIYRPVTPELGDAFQEVVFSRASVRTFDMERVPDQKLLLEAVKMATRSPSVCNRQTGRIHCYTGDEVPRLLEFQNGNRGFGHRVPVLFAITSDLRFFTGVDERNQGWIDGGMFAMLFLLALHSKGLGAVSLNWSVRNARDEQLRKAGKIPDHERIIMLIGCGFPEEDAEVPCSQRRPPDEIISFHEPS